MIKRWSLLLGFLFTMLSTACSSNEETKNEDSSTPEVDEVVARAQQPVKVVCVGIASQRDLETPARKKPGRDNWVNC